MSRSRRLSVTLVLIGACGCAAWPLLAAAQTADELARRRYDSGKAFMQQQKYADAMKDFDAVVTSFPTSAAAPDALLEIMSYQLDIARDPKKAAATADTLIKNYQLSRAGAMAHIVLGRSVLASGRSKADLDTALGEFERVPRLFPRSDEVPIALYYAAETLRIAGRLDEAIGRYRDLTLQYPRSIWAARAALGAATCFAFKGTPLDAFDELQRVRLRFPGTSEADVALAWNTTLFRLFLSGSPQAGYVFSGRAVTGPSGKLKDVIALAVTADSDNLIVANRQTVMIFKQDGASVRSVNALSPEGLFRDEAGGIVVLGKAGLQAERGQIVGLNITKPDGTPKRLEDLTSAVTVSTGDVLVGDGDSKTILRFSMAGKPLGRFAAARADRLAINGLDEVAALDRDGKTIAIIDRTGKTLHQIADKGTGYELRNPVDLAYDALGHLFVLDRGVGAVLVFDHATKLVSTFSIAEKSPGAFRGATAMALDSAARLLIYVPNSERVQIYQ